MDKNRPHSREKKIASGSANVNKGQKVGSGRPVGGSRPQNASQQRPVQQNHVTRSGGAGLLTIFLALPKKVRSIVLIVLAIILVFALLKSCSGGLSMGGFEDYSGYNDSGYSSSGSFGSETASDLTPTAPTTPTTPTTSGDNVDLTVSSLAREKRVTPIGGGKDTVTIMVYMCGTDLESKYGMATSDLMEMTKANISDNVNLIVGTGGCKQWKNSVVSNSTNQIYQVKSGGIVKLEDNFGNAAMTDPANLTNFIQYCNKNYEADRNILIFWDHGGGSISGYGYDEKNPRSSSMTLPMINSALSDAGCVFDWIGFDACLMATLETALVCNSYADYMIASEETEPGTGWDYTGWLNQLSDNTSIGTIALSKVLIDDFVKASTSAQPGAQVTLSITDLAELQGTVPDSFRAFATSTNELLQGNDYKIVSDARAGARQFAKSSKLNQIDLADFAQRIGTPDANALAKALQSCVKYNGGTISHSYGLSIYFPYETLNSMNGAVSAYNSLGMDSEYTKCIQNFASLEYGGQISASSASYGSSDLLGQLIGSYASSGAGSSSSPLGALLGGYTNSSGSASAGSSMGMEDIIALLSAFSGRSMPQEYSWVDTDFIADNAQTIAQNAIDPGRITVTEQNGKRLLRLTDAEWNLIQTVALNIFADDGEGFIDLGLDNTFEWDGDDLLLDWDGTWLTVDGHAAAYYLVSDTQDDSGSWTTVGRIPALLNGEAVNLQIVFDDANPYGTITGAYPLYEDVDVQAKGDIPLSAGDKVQFLCDYYSYDGSYSDSYTLGEAFTLGSSEPEIANMKLNLSGAQVTYRLTDIYGNSYWTPAWSVK